MSLEAQSALWFYLMVMGMVFVGASLALNDRYLPEKDRIWIGRIGLAAPLWPVSIVVALVVGFLFMLRKLRKAARGKR